jgi:hypothetical protein
MIKQHDERYTTGIAQHRVEHVVRQSVTSLYRVLARTCSVLGLGSLAVTCYMKSVHAKFGKDTLVKQTCPRCGVVRVEVVPARRYCSRECLHAAADEERKEQVAMHTTL